MVLPEEEIDPLDQIVEPETITIKSPKRGTYYENYPHEAPQKYSYEEEEEEHKEPTTKNKENRSPTHTEHYQNYPPDQKSTDRTEETHYYNSSVTLELSDYGQNKGIFHKNPAPDPVSPISSSDIKYQSQRSSLFNTDVSCT